MTAVEKLGIEFRQWAKDWAEFDRTGKNKPLSFDEFIEPFLEKEKQQHNETWDAAHQAGRFEGKGIAEENWQTFESHWEESFLSE